jgi:large subunit ribosomal protein L5
MNAENIEKNVANNSEAVNAAQDEVKSKSKSASKAAPKTTARAAKGEGKNTDKGEKKAAVKSEGKDTAKAEGKTARGESKTTAKTETPTPAKTGTKPAVKAGKEPVETPPEVKVISRLKIKYDKEVVPAFMKDMNYSSVMQVPRLKKIVINIGLGETITNSQAQEMAQKDLTSIAGQHPVITRAKKSIAAFKLRKGMPIGVMVTLRSNRMFDFLDKLVNVALPRSRDFQGVPADSFDGRGNYTLGIREQTIFPEIDYSKVDKVRGMQISIITSAGTDEEGKHLLRLLGMPFATTNGVEEEK